MLKLFVMLTVLLHVRKAVAFTTLIDATFTNHTNLRPLNAFNKAAYPASCDEATAESKKSGVYIIKPQNFGFGLLIVFCEYDAADGGWMVMQRRRDGCVVDFDRGWNDYKNGFGDLEGDFWLGLDLLHALTTISTKYELKVVMEDFEGEQRFARYSMFTIDTEENNYTMMELGRYSGTAGDSMWYNKGQRFSTKDKRNPNSPQDCPVLFGGGWWFGSCSDCNPNGKYLKGAYSNGNSGIHWFHFRGKGYSLKFIQLMIRPLGKQ